MLFVYEIRHNTEMEPREMRRLLSLFLALRAQSDGKVDLAGAGANAVSVMLGNGDGTFTVRVINPSSTVTVVV